MPPGDFITTIIEIFEGGPAASRSTSESSPRFSIDISAPPGPSLFEGEKAAYFGNVWVVNHISATLVLEFGLILPQREFPASDLTFNEVRYKGAMAFHEVYRQAGDAVIRQYLSNPLSLDAGTNRMGSLAFLRPPGTLLIPDQQYENWIVEVRDVHKDNLHRIEEIGKHSFA